MTYVDGYVLPLPKENRDAYRAMAQKAGAIWIKHGALGYKECIGNDLTTTFAPDSFPKAVNATDTETIIFAFVIFKSREHRDEVNAKVHADPDLEGCGDADTMPFDPSRMLYGGFETLVDL